MSNFTFCHNVFKSRLLLLRQNVSAGWKGLNGSLNPRDACLFWVFTIVIVDYFILSCMIYQTLKMMFSPLGNTSIIPLG